MNFSRKLKQKLENKKTIQQGVNPDQIQTLNEYKTSLHFCSYF